MDARGEKRLPGDRKQAELLVSRAGLAKREGQLDQMLNLAEQAYKHDGNGTEVNIILGEALVELGKADDDLLRVSRGVRCL